MARHGLKALFDMIGVWALIFWSWIKFFLPASKKSLDGEIVLVTGAGSGIGRLMSINFAKQGSTLVLWDINKEGNDETAEQIKQLGGKAHSYVVDVTKKEDVYRVAKQVTQEVGDVTILVNNAGVVAGKKLLDCPDELIERTMDVNVMAVFWTIKAFLPTMIDNNHGHLVTIGSIAGSCGCPGLVEYCASKFAAVGLHESLMLEMDIQKVTGVHTTLVQPYFIDTGMFDGVKVGIIPMLEQEYVAKKVVDAVQSNQKVLCLPKAMYVFPYLKSWMSVDAFMRLTYLVGGGTFMEGFVGRQKKNF
ncbi:epidermal retinol dehydrogenase 2-like [Ptychodera flava]|uniref:epidermal retinol dehydrogenase 2-like n=1 Tax=Ptychodera flava TaxID=63121 RepID=UPI003969E92E